MVRNTHASKMCCARGTLTVEAGKKLTAIEVGEKLTAVKAGKKAHRRPS